MPRKLREIAPGAAYHITQKGANQQPVFRSDTDRITYLTLLARCNEDQGNRILAWCLMSNQVQLVLIPQREKALPALLRAVHGRYSQYFNVRHNRTGPLWQGRYGCIELEEAQVITAIRYVERHAVRAKLVSEPQAYAWSSAAAHLNGPRSEVAPILDWDHWNGLGGVDGWSEMLRRPESIADVMTMQFAAGAG